ncbi:YbaB/EbfC family nucleoid-associated protein [Nocardia mexicana]|uniref:YbaB/EbfC DNA-binding family protein n=1 Tax=Nocardia mexicana TaxID=279262 RepID=A0A370GMY0_9NOCA|nr:YbaB/EbfC family nucleoid-associated protein [Nocardia mexicana]RDI43253.1 YbaB/EbfC DNA-binding family protein [Nocardia mexicana]
MSGGLEGAAEDLARWAENLERKAQQFQSLQGQMSAISVTETSSDNRISVTVDSSGVTTGIHLAAGTRGMDPAAVAAELMACTRRAQARLRNQVTDLVHTMVGGDSAAEVIVGQYAERFPDAGPEPGFAPASQDAPPAYAPPDTPPPPSYDGSSSPAAAYDAAPPASPPPPAPQPGSRKPNRDDVFIPEEPNDDDLYYQRKSWLE